ncbi:hypothetical protein [Sphingomonas nostoxanthinifaciens]|uniref:hypothetical protein n=1 Tax=Sphingomonas nostoxanthinifaciens TaxID=2872652 RepID=UPI001CC1F2DD|nr:hypothetical protein [Sphingomonas nostoxanthinifaciens]UAK25691.1 hypothetical protein K8P63_06020 [Sphingomonas nostoxanthinifaciens]
MRTLAMTSFALAAASLLAGASLAQTPKNQVALRQALNELQDARHQLQTDTSDTEGHREKAVGLVEAAMNEVRAGLAHDNTKPKK